MTRSNCPNRMWTVLLALRCGLNCAARRRSTLPLVADSDQFSRLDMVTSSSNHLSVRPSKYVGSTGLVDAGSIASVVGQKWKGMSWSWVCHGMLGEESMVWTRVSNIGTPRQPIQGSRFLGLAACQRLTCVYNTVLVSGTSAHLWRYGIQFLPGFEAGKKTRTWLTHL